MNTHTTDPKHLSDVPSLPQSSALETNVVLQDENVNAVSVRVTNMSLSPEATECDSAESIFSDEDKTAANLMPTLEDGLSSGQPSDIDDSPRRVRPPAALMESTVRDFFQCSNTGSTESSPAKQQALLDRKKALDKAIKVSCKRSVI